MSLADRFGQCVTFLAPNKETYLEIVRSLILDRGIIIDKDKLDRCAERFVFFLIGRSPRIARQFADSLQSKLALGIDPEKMKHEKKAYNSGSCSAGTYDHILRL